MGKVGAMPEEAFKKKKEETRTNKYIIKYSVPAINQTLTYTFLEITGMSNEGKAFDIFSIISTKVIQEVYKEYGKEVKINQIDFQMISLVDSYKEID